MNLRQDFLEIVKEIKRLEKDYNHVLSIPPATVFINAPRALMQLTATTRIEAMYWMLGKKRPQYACDDFSKVDQ